MLKIVNLWGGHAGCCSDWTRNITVCLKAGNIPHQSKKKKKKKSLHNFVWVSSYQNNRHCWGHFGLQCPPVLRASIQALLQDVGLATKAWLIKHHPAEGENTRRRSTITLSFCTDISELGLFSFDLNSQRNAVFWRLQTRRNQKHSQRVTVKVFIYHLSQPSFGQSPSW